MKKNVIAKKRSIYTKCGSSYAYYAFSATNGDTFDVTFRYYDPSTNSADTSINPFGLTGGFVDPPSEDAWTTYSASLTAGAGGTYWIRIFVDDTVSASGDGNVMYIDNMSIVKTN